ncbi:MAG: tagaturonate reductase [Algoriphagus sp.]|nr:tagaturonate reductase [Algoriphagus sp.]
MKKLNKQEVKIADHPTRILQFGNGNFLRAFADWMVDIANEKGIFDGKIHVVQIHSKTGFDQMKGQDCLFHVLEQGMKNGEIYQKTQLVSSVSGISFPKDDYPEYLKLGENPDLRFVISNTTESGIVFDPADSNFNSLPVTFPGKLTALLHNRFEHFRGDMKKGLIIIPCELIEKNGQVLKTCILNYAELWNLPKVFSEWIESACIFCDTLVDRIVPGFPKGNIKEIQEQIGFEDELIVMAEPFHLWVIQGPEEVRREFPLDLAGLDVKFVEDLTPYRTQKVRILNGGHTAMVPWAYLKGLRTVRESVENPEIGAFLREVIFEEIIPTLDMPKAQLEKFATDVLERFANPFIVHELKSIALNSISKFKVRVLPSLLGYWVKNQYWPEKLTLAFAALLVFYKGEFEGEMLPVNDDKTVMEFFIEAWSKNSIEETVTLILSKESLWGQNLDELPGLREKLVEAIKSILG